MFKLNFKKQLVKKPSFTLVEVLVAMAILMMLIGAMVGIEVMNIKLANSGKRQLQATGLARGALNLVRTIRDTNILKGAPTTVFDGIEQKTPPETPQYLKKNADNTWSLTTEDPSVTPYTNYAIKPLDSTTYTVEVTIE